MINLQIPAHHQTNPRETNMSMLQPESPLEQDKTHKSQVHKPKKIRSNRFRIVRAVIVFIAIVCGAWLVGLVPGPYIDYGPAPAPEEVRAHLLENPRYGQVEFLGYVRSEDDTYTSYKGGKLPAGWIGYSFLEHEARNSKYTTNITLYPCLYQRPSLEWYGTTVPTCDWQSPGWHYQGPEGVSKYHNRCGQPGGIADFHNVPEGSAFS